MSETDVGLKIRDDLQQQFPMSTWVKFHGGPFTQAGVGDIIGCLSVTFPGLYTIALYVEFEVKKPGEEHTLSALQEDRIKDLQALTAITGMVTCSQDAIDIITKRIKEIWNVINV